MGTASKQAVLDTTHIIIDFIHDSRKVCFHVNMQIGRNQLKSDKFQLLQFLGRNVHISTLYF